MNQNICQIVTEQILAQLDAGVVPWLRPWNLVGGAVSHSTGRAYSTLNQMILDNAGEWATFNQIKTAGGKVKKGSKSRVVVFWKMLNAQTVKDEETGEETTVATDRLIPYLQYYRVFNLSDAEGIEPKYRKEGALPNAAQSNATADEIARAYLEREKIELVDDTVRDDAYYRVDTDKIHLPKMSQFKSTEEYYGTLLHEITHSTGAKNRLNRRLEDLSIEKRAQEELVAEIGAAMLCSYCGVATDAFIKNASAYLKGWRDKIAADNTLIVVAAGRAQKAVEFILGKKLDEINDNEKSA